MENATKALEMAAGVLIAILVIGLCAYAYNNLSEEKKIEQSAESASQATDFNKTYEAFNKSGLQGSEILSLANKIADYNTKEAEKKGYQKMELSVTINNTTTQNSTYFTKKRYENAKDITDEYKTLSKKIKESGDKTIDGKKVSEWSKQASASLPVGEVRTAVDEYKNLLNDQTGMARKTFKTPTVEYDKNGRIIKMTFVEGT